jgi:hypothetical protein
MKIFDVTDIEEAAAESEQDRRDLRSLHGHLDELLKHDDAMRIPIATRRLIDSGIDAVVVAKMLLIGDRDGGLLYRLSARSPALERDERIAVDLVSVAMRDADVAALATTCVAGAVWLATQFKLERSLLRQLVAGAQRRARRANRRGYGAVDIVDHHGIANRAWIVDAIDHAQLPSYAPLEFERSKV